MPTEPSSYNFEFKSSKSMQKFLCEFIGTYVLVFFAAGAVMIDVITGGTLGPIGSGIISGLVVTAIIYTFGYISGAHVNPALSITAALIGHLHWRLLPGYIIAQMAGSALAGLSLLWLLGNHADIGANLPNTELDISLGAIILIEFFLSFFLMLVVASVGLDKRSHGPLAGIAVGSVVAIEVMLMGPIAGAAMNPARAFGPYLARGDFDTYWIYIIAPIAGMITGGFVYRLTHNQKIN